MSDLSSYLPIYVNPTNGIDSTEELYPDGTTTQTAFKSIAMAWYHVYFGEKQVVVLNQDPMILELQNVLPIDNVLTVVYASQDDSCYFYESWYGYGDEYNNNSDISVRHEAYLVYDNGVDFYSWTRDPFGNWYGINPLPVLTSRYYKNKSDGKFVLDVIIINNDWGSETNTIIIPPKTGWPNRIALRSSIPNNNSTVSINGAGYAGNYNWEYSIWSPLPTNGENINLISNQSIKIDISCPAASIINTAGTGGFELTGGNLILEDCKLSALNTTGGGYSSVEQLNGTTFKGGDIQATNCIIEDDITSGGGFCAYGNMTPSTEFDGTALNNAGNINLNKCSITSNEISAIGGGHFTCGMGGTGGTITLQDCVINSTTIINASGGASSAWEASCGNMNGIGGVINLIGSTNIPNTMNAKTITTTQLNKGRGINGANILGVI